MVWNWTAIGTVALAVAAVILAFLNYRIIRQTGELNRKERAERRLKEIIDWGEAILGCRYMHNINILDIPILANFKGFDLGKFIDFKLFLEYSALQTKHRYLSNIALEFDVSVQKAVDDVNEYLVEQIKHIDDELSARDQKQEEESGGVSKQYTSKLKASVDKMIAVATGFMPK
jgi:hypothetical protein